ncbi:MAG: hypothetical protein JWQ46_76 [Phenylobacterium sp.]|nr:hypothetical protein [Phenylobacterium sp.]
MLFVLAAAVLAAGAPAAPEPTDAVAKPAPAVASAKASGDADRLVCKKEIVTGSMFPVKVCRDKQKAAQNRQDDQDQLRNVQRMGGPLVR